MNLTPEETAALVAQREQLRSAEPDPVLDALYDLQEYQEEYVHVSFAKDYLRKLEHWSCALMVAWNLLVLGAGAALGWWMGATP